MATVDIDLEQDDQDESESLSVTPGEKESDEAVESNYPHFHFESAEPLNIPKSGRMTVEYKIVYQNDESELGHLYKVDLFRIVGIEGKKAAPAEKTEDALDRLAEEKTKENQNVQS